MRNANEALLLREAVASTSSLFTIHYSLFTLTYNFATLVKNEKRRSNK